MIREGWESCIVAATGPSFTAEVAEQCRGRKVIAVNDAWQRVPFADVLYVCDRQWWDVKWSESNGFRGERWSSQHSGVSVDDDKVKSGHADKYRLNLVRADYGDGFCFEPGKIHYGHNAGFQGVNLAIQFGAKHIDLVGFDMRWPDGKSHFFGDHPEPLTNNPDFRTFIQEFNRAAQTLPAEIDIVNCTPGSALHCFPFGTLNEIDRDRHRRAG